jgi:hypothetical protein
MFGFNILGLNKRFNTLAGGWIAAVESIGSALSFIKEMRVQATLHRYVLVLKCILMAMDKK